MTLYTPGFKFVILYFPVVGSLVNLGAFGVPNVIGVPKLSKSSNVIPLANADASVGVNDPSFCIPSPFLSNHI